MIYSLIGDESSALEHLERHSETRQNPIRLLRPEFYAMRDNPRYRRFMADLGIAIIEP